MSTASVTVGSVVMSCLRFAWVGAGAAPRSTGPAKMTVTDGRSAQAHLGRADGVAGPGASPGARAADRSEEWQRQSIGGCESGRSGAPGTSILACPSLSESGPLGAGPYIPTVQWLHQRRQPTLRFIAVKSPLRRRESNPASG